MPSLFAGFNWGGGGNQGGGGGPNPNIQIPGLQAATDQLTQLNTAVSGLNTALQNLAQQQQKLGTQIGGMFNQIGQNAQQAANNVNNVNQAVQSTVQSTQGGGGISKLFGVASAVAGSDILKDLAMFPLRFITQTLGTNRQLSMNLQSQLAGQMFATGGTAYGPTGIASQLARFPGNVMGSPEDLINLMTTARGAGAMMDLGSARQGSARTTGFLQAVSEMQKITPATPVGALGQAVAQQLQPQAQQVSAFYTGGAMSMIARGGRVKSLSEWAEGILRWIEDMRPPPFTGKPFGYGELLAQYFPGSNIDAWLTNVGGITPDMKEYWWDYSLGKANRTNSTQGAFQIVPMNTTAARGGNQPWERLQAVAAKGRGELNLAGTMAGTYANKEQTNRWFNDLMANVQQRVIPAQTSRGALSALQYLPDTLEELLMGLLERGGALGALVGGGIGYGIHGAQSLAKNLIGGFTAGQDYITQGGLDDLMQIFSGQFTVGGGMADALASALKAAGDEPEPGIGDSPGMEWGMHGTTSTAGLHPDMKRKVGDMMRANPRLRVNSGLRDTATQQNLRSKGYSRVSGKPSAHTRGMAADLGPASEYGWIMKNAGKFGLRSGKSFGEPWHVGIGDPGDPMPNPPAPPDDPYAPSIIRNGIEYKWNPYGGADGKGEWQEYAGSALEAVDPAAAAAIESGGRTNADVTSGGPGFGAAQMTTTADSGGPLGGLGALFNIFTKGFTRDTAITAIGGIVPAVMTLFMGAFGMDEPGKTDFTGPLGFDPGLYDALVKAAGTFHFGGLQSQGQVGGFDYGKSFGSGIARPDLSSVASLEAARTGTGASTLAGALKALGKDPAGLSAGVMVAHLAHFAGFPNNSIDEVVGISKRESGWDPSSHYDNPASGDDSYGLMQINMIGGLGPERRKAYGLSSNDELLDPFTNLKAAYSLSSQGTDFHHWGGYKGRSDTYNTDMVEARQIAKEAGYGDAPENLLGPESYAQYMVGNGPSTASPTGVVFHNQFVINAAGGPPSSGGIDVRRVVGQMADQLEAEMKKRLVRSN